MGIYGHGNAFNLSFSRQRPLSFGAVSTRRMPPPPVRIETYTQHINIKNGPSGFWAFMRGLMGGGMGMGMGCYNTGIGSSVYGTLNQASMNQQAQNPIENQKAKLKTIYSAYTVLDNEDGTFSLTKGDNTIYKKGTFEELTNAALEAGKTTPQGTEPKADAQPAANQTPPAATTPEPAAASPDNKESANPTTANAAKGADGTTSTTTTNTTPTKIEPKVGEEIKAKDEVNGTTKDFGQIKQISEEKEQGFPKTIKAGNEELTFVKVADNGEALYKTTGGKQQTYRLTKNGDTIVLLQRKGDENLGAGKANWSREQAQNISTEELQRRVREEKEKILQATKNAQVPDGWSKDNTD